MPSDREVVARALAAGEPALRRRFRAGLSWVRDRRALSEWARLVEAGRVDEVAADVERWARSFSAASARVLAGAAEGVASVLSALAPTHYDPTTARAARRVHENAMRLVREWTYEQRVVGRMVVADGVRRGQNPRVTARALRASVGLTSRQQQAVENYRRLLEQGSTEALDRRLRDRRFDGTVRSARRDGRALTAAQVDRMVDRYRERFVAHRAETIARTEALRAVHEGAEQMWWQAVERGDVDLAEVERTWRQARLKNRRESHTPPMSGQRRGLGEAFVSNHGNRLAYPGDPDAPGSETVRCRCVVVTRVAPRPGRGEPRAEPAVPRGFSEAALADGIRLFRETPNVRVGVPSYRDARRLDPQATAFVARPSDLAARRLYGIDTGGARRDDERTRAIRDAWARGEAVAAIEVHVTSQGDYFVADGNHRLIAAADDDRPVLVQFRAISGSVRGMDRMDTVLRSIQR